MSDRPKLLPEPWIRWGGMPWDKYKSDPIKDMCDYGAREFNRGECDLVNFDCIGGEVELIKAYMSEHHPGVSISFGSPRVTLAHAVKAWEQRKSEETK